jgi:hypothetical protein
VSTPLKVPDETAPISPGYLENALRELTAATRRLADHVIDSSLRVDEYIPQPLYGAPMQVAQLEVQPQFQRIPERITHIVVTGPAQATPLLFESAAPVTGPAANANIIQVGTGALPVPGLYTVNWTVSLTGTMTAAETDNFKLVFGSTLATSINPNLAGDYPQASVQITIPPGNVNTLAVRAVAAGGAAALYAASISISPVLGTPFALQLGDRYWPGLALPQDGCWEKSVGGILLNPNDRRILTTSFPGQWFLELIGIADVRNPI